MTVGAGEFGYFTKLQWLTAAKQPCDDVYMDSRHIALIRRRVIDLMRVGRSSCCR